MSDLKIVAKRVVRYTIGPSTFLFGDASTHKGGGWTVVVSRTLVAALAPDHTLHLHEHPAEFFHRDGVRLAIPPEVLLAAKEAWLECTEPQPIRTGGTPCATRKSLLS